MPNNYVLLERIELNASAASVTFANIPQTGYTDLKIVMSARSTGTSIGMSLLLNGSSANISTRAIEGNGASAISYTSTNIVAYTVPSGATGNTFGNTEIYIPNHTSSSNKSISVDSVTENNATTAYSLLNAFLWSNTAAITSLTLQSDSTGSNSIAAGSTFSLYGLAALGTTPAIAPKASGGNRIDNDGTYWYHTFTSSGSFVPQTGLTADILVIAGGGGGLQGGGGAGGLLAFTSETISPSNYTVTIGAGGSSYANGSNTTFQGKTAAVGGGRGGSNSTINPAGNGGSGGGSMGNTTSPFGAFAGGTGTSGQGNNGGSGFWGNSYNGGGGGGKGAVGGDSGTTQAGNGNGGVGGAGSNAYSSWATATSTGVGGFYAGGGGGTANLAGTSGWNGGAGGSGGGGAGTVTTNGTNATANTGGGGGGGQTNGGTGGSGIVIIRYLAV